MTRSAAVHPGILRTNEQQIGVRTRYGNHMPPAVAKSTLQTLIDGTVTSNSRTVAATLFIQLSKALPFEDGNKRTALLVANSVLPAGHLLIAPYSPDCGDSSESRFLELLSRAYIFNELDPLIRFMLRSCFVEI